MHILTRKPKGAQQTAAAKSAIPGRAPFGHRHEANALHPHRAIGNDAAQRLPEANAGSGAGEAATTAGVGFDFSRIPVHAAAPGRLQTKLALGPPGDVYEQEADRVAEQVMRLSEPPVQSEARAGPSDHAITPAARVQTKSLHAGNADGIAAPPIVHEVLNSPGQPLDGATRAFMEPRFGSDFGHVRVHTDAKAAESAGAINAAAYTVGYHIAVAGGRYDPSHTEGRRLLAHELVHVVQQRGGTSAVMRQMARDKVEDTPIGDEGKASEPHQCSDDIALEEEYDEWIHYDAEKDAKESALVNRINQEVFGPINRERNKLAADSFENTEAQKKAFPTRTLAAGASATLTRLFNTPTYARLHSADSRDKEYQEEFGLKQPAGDFSSTGKVEPNVFGAKPRAHAIWDYRGDKADAAGGNRMDATGGDFLKVDAQGIGVAGWDHHGDKPDAAADDFDSKIDAEGIKAEPNVSGFAEFSDPKGESIFVPQLGFPSKPKLDNRQVMCRQVPVVKAGRAKQLRGPTGQHVTGKSLRDMLHGDKHFFGAGTSPKITDSGEGLGWRAGPDQPVHWWGSQLPDDSENRDEKGKSSRERLEAMRRKQADAILASKRKSYERLKEFYLKRAAFIEKYQGYLK